MSDITTKELNEPNSNPTLPSNNETSTNLNTPICLDRPISTNDVTQLTNSSSFTIDQLYNMIPLETELTARGDVPFPTSLPPILSPYTPPESQDLMNMWSFIILKNGVGLYVNIYSISNSGISGFLLYPPTIYISVFIPMYMVSQINFL